MSSTVVPRPAPLAPPTAEPASTPAPALREDSLARHLPSAEGARAQKRSAVVQLVLGGLAGAVLGLGFMILIDRGLELLPTLSMTQELVTLALLPLVFLLVVLLHEAGHLAGGWLAGFRAHLIAVGPAMLVREGAGAHERWRLRRASLGMAGGLALSVPVLDAAADPGADAVLKERLRRGMLRVVLAGPLASLVGAALPLALLTAVGPSRLHPFAVNLLLVFALFSFAICLGTLFPMRTGGYVTDGKRALQLRRGSPHAAREAATLGIVATTFAGVRPRDWSPLLVRGMHDGAQPGSSDAATAHSVSAEHALDAGRVDEARAHYREALAASAALPAPARGPLYLEAAYVAAVHDDDAAGARALLDAATPNAAGLGMTPHLVPFVRAAIACVDRDADAAAPALAEARTKLRAAMPTGSLRLIEEEMDGLEARIAALRAARAAA